MRHLISKHMDRDAKQHTVIPIRFMRLNGVSWVICYVGLEYDHLYVAYPDAKYAEDRGLYSVIGDSELYLHDEIHLWANLEASWSVETDRQLKERGNRNERNI